MGTRPHSGNPLIDIDMAPSRGACRLSGKDGMMVRRRMSGTALALGFVVLSAAPTVADESLGTAEPAHAERPGSGGCAAATPIDPGFVARIEDRSNDRGFVVIAEDRSNDVGFFPASPCASGGR